MTFLRFSPRFFFCDNLNRLWSDPSYKPGWHFNEARQISHTFGPNVLRNFLQTYDLDLVCRAHMMVEDGYEFFANQQLVTVFSAPNYCERDNEVMAFPNAAAILCVDRTLMCSFQILQPETYRGGARLMRFSRAEVQRFQPSEYVTDAEFAIPSVPPLGKETPDDLFPNPGM